MLRVVDIISKKAVTRIADAMSNIEMPNACNTYLRKSLLDMLNNVIAQIEHAPEFSTDVSLLKMMREDLEHLSLSKFYQKYTQDILIEEHSVCQTLMKNMHDFLFSKNRFNDLISQENIDKPARLQKQFNAKALPKTELLIKLITQYKQEIETKIPDIHLALINHHELPGKINALKSADTHQRCILIVQNVLHYSTLDIEYDPIKKQLHCIIVDAAEDHKTQEYIELLKNFDGHITMFGSPRHDNPVQIESGPCGFYAYRHFKKCSKKSDLHAHIKSLPYISDNGINYIAWSSLPPTFIRYAQNKSLQSDPVQSIDSYIEKSKKKMNMLLI